jgi:hypothetical protein
MRTVPIPNWVKSAIDTWITSAELESGVLFRSVSKTGKVWGDGFTPKVIWSIVRQPASDLQVRCCCPPRATQACARLRYPRHSFLADISVQIGSSMSHFAVLRQQGERVLLLQT